MEKIYILVFTLLVFLSFNLISAERFGYNYLEDGENLNPSLNYSNVNVNNSNFLDGYDSSFFYPNSNPNSYITNVEETDALSLHLNQDNWNLGSNWLTYSNPTLAFNESKLEIIYYNASQPNSIVGTIDDGTTISETQHNDGGYDGNTFNFSEEAGSPGLEFYMNFTGVDDFNQGVMRYKTSSLAGAYPIIQLWNYDKLIWEDYPAVAESESFATITQPVFDSSEHIGTVPGNDGVVRMRLYKASNGNTNNHYYVDWVAISKSYGVPSGEEVDPLSIHTDAINLTQMNYTESGVLNILESWLTTFINTFGFLTSTTNPFDQSLNTTDGVEFNNANLTKLIVNGSELGYITPVYIESIDNTPQHLRYIGGAGSAFKFENDNYEWDFGLAGDGSFFVGHEPVGTFIPIFSISNKTPDDAVVINEYGISSSSSAGSTWGGDVLFGDSIMINTAGAGGTDRVLSIGGFRYGAGSKYATLKLSNTDAYEYTGFQIDSENVGGANRGDANFSVNDGSGLTSYQYTAYTGNTTFYQGLKAKDFYSEDGSIGITDTSSYWLCDADDCSSTCQVSIKDGLITGCS